MHEIAMTALTPAVNATGPFERGDEGAEFAWHDKGGNRGVYSFFTQPRDRLAVIAPCAAPPGPRGWGAKRCMAGITGLLSLS